MAEVVNPMASNPFPGLRPFNPDEDHLFFGREEQVDSMVDILARHRFLAVVGTSGSGKSSLVNCGLEPALHQGLLASAGSHWRIARFRPEARPIQNLAEALAAHGVLFPAEAEQGGLTLKELIDSTLRLSRVGLLDIVEQASRTTHFRLLVVVDQFEELFRYRQSEEASAFVGLLLAVLEAQQEQIHIVLTMRSDFLGDCTQFPGLAEAINRALYLVPRLTREERRAAITNPVLVAGATISPVLVTRLVNDVGDNPDQLSILQHALNRTWAHWQEQGAVGPLDLEHYEAIGTMAKALDRHAEEAYGELADPAAGEGAESRLQTVCRRVFQAITDKASEGRGIRRPTQWRQLQQITEATEEELGQVIGVFRHPSRAFLMPPAGSPLDERSVIDISHESLMRLWERLQQWGHGEAEAAQIYRRLAETAQLHDRGQANTLRDPELTICRKWLEEHQPNAAWAERYNPGFQTALAFLQRSQEERDGEQAEQERRQREAADQQLRWKLLATGLGCSLIGIVAATAGWLFAIKKLQEAKIASAGAYAATAKAQADESPFQALLNGLVAAEALADQPGELLALSLTMKQALDHNLLIGELTAGQKGVSSLVALRNGDLLSGGADGSLQRWRNGRKDGEPIRTKQGAITSLVELANGDWITGGADGTLQRWRAGKEVGEPIQTGAGTVLSLAVLRNGELLSGGFDGNLQRWRQGEKVGQPIVKVGQPIATGQGIVFSLLQLNNGDWISGGMDGNLQRWRDGQTIGSPIATGQGPVRSLAELADGDWVSGGFDGSLQRWHEGRKVGPSVATGYAEVRSLAQLANGEVVSGGQDDTLRHWQAWQPPGTDASLKKIDDFNSLVQLSNGDLLSGDSEGMLQRWRGGKKLGNPIPAHPRTNGGVNSLTVLRNGDWISSGGDGTLQRWREGHKLGNPLKTHKDGVTSLLALRNGDWISGGKDGSLQLWHEGSRVGGPKPSEQGEIMSLLELANGDWISGGANGTVQLWRGGKRVGNQIPSSQRAAISLIELEKGEWISGGADGSLQRWNNGQKVGSSIPTQLNQVSGMLKQSNGGIIASSDDNRVVLFASSRTILSSACQELRNHPALLTPKTDIEKAASSYCKAHTKETSTTAAKNFTRQ